MKLPTARYEAANELCRLGARARTFGRYIEQPANEAWLDHSLHENWLKTVWAAHDWARAYGVRQEVYFEDEHYWQYAFRNAKGERQI